MLQTMLHAHLVLFKALVGASVRLLHSRWVDSCKDIFSRKKAMIYCNNQCVITHCRSSNQHLLLGGLPYLNKWLPNQFLEKARDFKISICSSWREWVHGGAALWRGAQLGRCGHDCPAWATEEVSNTTITTTITTTTTTIIATTTIMAFLSYHMTPTSGSSAWTSAITSSEFREWMGRMRTSRCEHWTLYLLFKWYK